MSKGQNVHTPEEIVRIRRAAAVTAQIRDLLAESVRPGMTTMDVDMRAAELIRASGGKSAFLNYRGYPGNVCISVNEEVVHGIASRDRVIGEHDIVSLDVGVEFDGALGDTAVTVSDADVFASHFTDTVIVTDSSYSSPDVAVTVTENCPSLALVCSGHAS